MDSGVDVNIRHPLGWTALQTAAINGKVEIIKYLIANGADINAGDNFDNVYKISAERKIHPTDSELYFYC